MIVLAASEIELAAKAVRSGAVVAFPTETYYGLAVDACDEAALGRLFSLKGRNAEKASALLVSDLTMLAGLCSEVPARAVELSRLHWPGPLTLALPARPQLPSAIVLDGFVAARVSSHPLAHALVCAVGRAVTATSANPAGLPPVRDASQVATYFGDKDIYLLDGGETPGGPPSTLVRCRGHACEVLRHGAIVI